MLKHPLLHSLFFDRAVQKHSAKDKLRALETIQDLWRSSPHIPLESPEAEATMQVPCLPRANLCSSDGVDLRLPWRHQLQGIQYHHPLVLSQEAFLLKRIQFNSWMEERGFFFLGEGHFSKNQTTAWEVQALSPTGMYKKIHYTPR